MNKSKWEEISYFFSFSLIKNWLLSNLFCRYVASWIETRRYQSDKANLTVLFDKYVPPYLEQLRTRFKTVNSIPENSMVQVRSRIKTIHILRKSISETSIEHVVLCRSKNA